MNRSWWNRLLVSRSKGSKREGKRALMLEQLEERCVLNVDGFGNVARPTDEVGNNPNPLLATLGTAGTDLLRLSPVAYADGISKPGMGGKTPTFIPSPRTVSNILSNQATTLFGPPSTDVNTVDTNGLSNFGYVFGQFMDHDMDLTPDGGAVFNIPVDPNHPAGSASADPIGSLAFTRSQTDPATGTSTSNPLQQVNVNTSFLDLSQVYGSTLAVSNALRTFSNGLLKTSPGNLMPLNNATYFSPTAADPDPNQLAELNMANNSGAVSNDQLFAAGDVRANENVELMAMQTLFLRNHNLLAGELQQQNPTWTDEQLYQEARKLNIAEYQNIIYTQYLPDLLGPTALTAYAGYQSSVNPSIATEFSTIAFRFGHSLLNNSVPRDNNDGSAIGSTELTLAQDFFDPNLINPSGATDPLTNLVSTDIGAVLKGDADNNAQAMDVMAVSDIRNLLFGNGPPGSPTGEDLISRDIWRAHDDGIGTYNQVRGAFGLSAITDDATFGFDQITSNVQVQQLLEQAYSTTLFNTDGTRRTKADGTFFTAGDIDPFAAGIAEDHVPGSDMGPLFTTILATQFERLRDGDQFFYRNESFNFSEQLILLQGRSLGQVITLNSGVTNLQSDVFRLLSTENGQTNFYYATSNGQAALTGSSTGAMLSAPLYSILIGVLDPNHTGVTVLVDAHGHYLSDSFLQSYSNVKSFLLTPSLNVANLLSTQLLTTEFNVLLGNVDSATSIYVPAVTFPGTSFPLLPALQNTLTTHGVSNPSGVAGVQSLLNATIAELAANPNPGFGSSDQLFEASLAICLGAINNNEDIFIL